jgi:hypothetical protein
MIQSPQGIEPPFDPGWFSGGVPGFAGVVGELVPYGQGVEMTGSQVLL